MSVLTYLRKECVAKSQQELEDLDDDSTDITLLSAMVSELTQFLLLIDCLAEVAAYYYKIGPQCVHVWLTSAVVICNRS